MGLPTSGARSPPGDANVSTAHQRGLAMSVTVVVRRRARPGADEALIALMSTTIARPHSRASARARMFQGLDDPRVILYLGEWASREEYLTRDSTPPDDLDSLAEGAPERFFCQQLDLFEVPGVHVALLGCTIIQTPPAAGAALITYLFERSGPVLQAAPGLALRAVYQDIDVPSRLLSLIGWNTAAELEAARRDLKPVLAAPLLELGATMESFFGRARADIARPRPP
jgi:hypothetical protein